MATMYEVIEQLCSERGIKPGKLCSELGISRGILSDLKAGRTKKLSAQNLAKVSAFLGVSADYILEQSGFHFTELFKNAGGPPTATDTIITSIADNITRKTIPGPEQYGSDILDEVDIAFYGDFKELTEDDKATVRDMVRIMRERRAKKQEK